MDTRDTFIASNTASPSDIFEENKQLRAKLEYFLQKGHENQQILSRHQDINLKLIASISFVDLIEHIFVTLKKTTQLDIVTLLITDSKNNVAQMIASLPIDSEKYPNLIVLPEEKALHAALFGLHEPELGPHHPKRHQLLFPNADPPPKSVAIIPLRRHSKLIGFMNFGSHDIERFTKEMATDFIRLQGSIVTVCLENTIQQEQLKHLSLTDALTQTGNRRYIEQRLQEELAVTHRWEDALSCLYIDIDHFKMINDKQGHAAGDYVLCEMAKRIKKELRISDVLGRFGGEEFVVILPKTDMDNAQRIAERIRIATSQSGYQFTNETACHATISIGGCTLRTASEHNSLSESAEYLLQQADAALYRAKQEGRNRVIWAR